MVDERAAMCKEITVVPRSPAEFIPAGGIPLKAGS
jgi:hypothetical protein